MEKERAREIYNKIKKENIKAVDEFISTRKEEELFIDFKRSANDGTTNTLHQIDRNNLSKAMSGFGNSEGGVIIWGVDCSRDLDGADVVKAKQPIQNVDRFISLLQGVISGCTIPVHSQVENYAIKEKGKKSGFVVTLIPKSNKAPHQTIYNNQYYIRAGSSFVATPHSVLAGMFGKRPQPWVYLTYTVGPVKIKERPTGEKEILCEIGLALYNGGQGIARDTFLNAQLYPLPGKNCNSEFDIRDRVNWTGSLSFGIKLGVISKEDFRIAPGNLSQPVIVKVSLLPPFEEKIKMELSCGCENGMPFNDEWNNSKENVEITYRKILNIANLDESQKLVAELLGIKNPSS